MRNWHARESTGRVPLQTLSNDANADNSVNTASPTPNRYTSDTCAVSFASCESSEYSEVCSQQCLCLCVCARTGST